jgi:hypothetical protein
MQASKVHTYDGEMTVEAAMEMHCNVQSVSTNTRHDVVSGIPRPPELDLLLTKITAITVYPTRSMQDPEVPVPCKQESCKRPALQVYADSKVPIRFNRLAHVVVV